jgi:hypothetical protein
VKDPSRNIIATFVMAARRDRGEGGGPQRRRKRAEFGAPRRGQEAVRRNTGVYFLTFLNPSRGQPVCALIARSAAQRHSRYR